MVRRAALLMILLASSLCASALPSFAVDNESGPSSIPGAESVFFVPVAQRTITSDVLTWWTQNNGAQTLGMPVNSTDSKSRQIFRWGSIRKGKGGALTRDQAGAQLVSSKYGYQIRDGGRARSTSTPVQAFAALDHQPSGSSVIYDKTTGHSVKGSFAKAYTELGGRAVLGRPLSEAYTWSVGRLQWFENAALYEVDGHVQLYAIGPELANRTNRTSASVTGGYRPVYLDRFAPTSGDGTVANADTVFAPVAFQIPSIGVDANVENVPVIDGVMQTPEDVWAVGWYYDLPAPGQFTNVVMAAHRDWWGVGPVVFFNLDQVQVGDMIYLWDAAGTGATYQVTAVTIVDAEINAGEVVRDKNADTLTLITCGGAFDGEHYLSRIIVESVRV